MTLQKKERCVASQVISLPYQRLEVRFVGFKNVIRHLKMTRDPHWPFALRESFRAGPQVIDEKGAVYRLWGSGSF